MSGKHYFAGLIPSNEALSREPLQPNEHFTGIIGSLSVSVVPALIAVPVAFGRLEQATVTLLKGVTEVLPAEFNPSERPRPKGSWLTQYNRR